ncbi:hypothetical protein JTE90_018052 [Oedothorax gibbosus]|uniref:Uncharacterized protein n=1 Tax=Oedothorax gibbosus TaxID=931172 RepID=A0AAV6TDD3_9ARAC|nr:hypothetical protein JTE90_018052 [Oedothorax gibbosus]
MVRLSYAARIPRSDDRFATSRTVYGPPTRVSSGLVWPVIVQHLSGPPCGRSTPPLPQVERGVGLRWRPRPARERGSRLRATSAAVNVHFAAGLIQDPLDSRTC